MIAALFTALACSLGDARCEVSALQRDGEILVSVRADSAPLALVMSEIATHAGLHVQSDPIAARTAVTVELVERPWRRAVETVLASAGLRAEIRGDTLALCADVGAGDTADELYEAALASYLRVERDFPEHELSLGAQLAQAEIEVARGNVTAARAHCEALLERDARPEIALRALGLAAELSMREGAWDRAAARWAELLRREPSLEVELRGRRELARSWTMLGQHERALAMVDALDSLTPATDNEDSLARKAIRARALAGVGRSGEALALIAELPDSASDTLELRALATEATGASVEAARAWLAFAEGADVYQLACALDHAARLALEGGEPLAVLFIAKLARQRGVELAPALVGEAHAALGLDTGDELTQRIDAAERALATASFDAAFAELLAVLPARDALDASQMLRFDLAYARALAAVASLDDALIHLRGVLTRVTDEAARRSVYLLAGELCERAERFDDAALAYQGRL